VVGVVSAMIGVILGAVSVILLRRKKERADIANPS
jgi:hypothetical protein